MFQKLPDHPGIPHYLIHACDNEELASRGLAAARAYAGIAPSAPHALHMLGKRTGRNAGFGAAGNVFAAVTMGVIGYLYSTRAIFFFVAILSIPTLFSIFAIRGDEIDYERSRGATGAEAPVKNKTAGLRGSAWPSASALWSDIEAKSGLIPIRLRVQQFASACRNLNYWGARKDRSEYPGAPRVDRWSRPAIQAECGSIHDALVLYRPGEWKREAARAIARSGIDKRAAALY